MIPVLIKFLNHDEGLFGKIEEFKPFIFGFPLDTLSGFLFLFLCIHTFKFLITLIYYRIHATFLQNAHFEIVNTLFLRLTGLGYLEFKNQSLPENLRKVTVDSYDLIERIFLPILVIMTETITLFCLMLLMCLYNPTFFFNVFFILIIIFTLYSKLISKRIRKKGIAKSLAETSLIQLVQDYVGMYKEIKITNYDNVYTKSFMDLNKISSVSYKTLHFFKSGTKNF